MIRVDFGSNYMAPKFSNNVTECSRFVTFYL